jgi:hypothetical protein
MAYYIDLSLCDYFKRWQDVLVAIGWLDLNHPYATGEVSPAFFSALVSLLENPWQPAALAGYQRCAFCRFTGGPSELRFDERKIQLGNANLFVPAKNGKVYVAPALVAHYVDAHGYLPPMEFQEAVIKCPAMKSFAYLKQM